MSRNFYKIPAFNKFIRNVSLSMKKKTQIGLLPALVQKVISEIGMEEISMHYLRNHQKNIKVGITLYMKTKATEESVRKTIEEFGKFKIHAKRVRTPPKGDADFTSR